MGKVTYSPLRYPGGKGQLINFIKKVYTSNKLLGKTYVEPYTGGGAVALALLMDGFTDKIVINDYDRSIYAFWYSLLNHSQEFLELIKSTDVTIENWKKQKLIQKNKDTAEILELGFSTFFLNRTNRSGIIKAGVIGGIKQDGEWKMDVRFNKTDLLKRFERIINYKSQIELHNLDTCDLITTLTKQEKFIENSFFYFDPPYYLKGKDLYVNFYKDQDHIELRNKIFELNDGSWILSYDNHSRIDELYSRNKKITYNLSYSIERKYQGSEVIIYSDNIILPIKNSNLKNVKLLRRRKSQKIIQT